MSIDTLSCNKCYAEVGEECECKPCYDCGERVPVLAEFGDGKGRCSDCHAEARQAPSEDELFDDWVLGIEDY